MSEFYLVINILLTRARALLGAYAQDGKTIMAIFDYQGMVQLEASVAKAFALSLEPQTCQR
ncbi:hypothetical protein, partial [Vibrio cincinnatiensis]